MAAVRVTIRRMQCRITHLPVRAGVVGTPVGRHQPSVPTIEYHKTISTDSFAFQNRNALISECRFKSS